MKTITAPTFSSPELQKAVDEVRPILEGADDARNRISGDIKALEAYLQGLDLKTPFIFPLGKYVVAESDNQLLAATIEFGGSTAAEIEEEALVWGPELNGKLRLLFQVSHWEGSVDVDLEAGPLFWDESTLRVESKPLIETKFEIRKRMYKHLTPFTKALGKDLSIEPASRDMKAQLEDLPF